MQVPGVVACSILVWIWLQLRGKLFAPMAALQNITDTRDNLPLLHRMPQLA